MSIIVPDLHDVLVHVDKTGVNYDTEMYKRLFTIDLKPGIFTKRNKSIIEPVASSSSTSSGSSPNWASRSFWHIQRYTLLISLHKNYVVFTHSVPIVVINNSRGTTEAKH